MLGIDSSGNRIIEIQPITIALTVNIASVIGRRMENSASFMK